MNEDELKKHIGRALQKVRQNAGYSSAEAFALSVGESSSTYTAYEQGSRPLPITKAWKYADIFNCSLDDICGRLSPRVYADPDQQRLNDCYENMNEKGQATLVSVAQSMEKDATNRLKKNSAEHLASAQTA